MNNKLINKSMCVAVNLRRYFALIKRENNKSERHDDCVSTLFVDQFQKRAACRD